MITKSLRPRVCIESPLRGDYTRNLVYADALMLDSLRRGEAPFLGHLLYTRVLDDAFIGDRDVGIDAHCAYVLAADHLVVGMDLGPPTDGMQHAIDLAEAHEIVAVPRWLGDDWEARLVPSRSPGQGMHEAHYELARLREVIAELAMLPARWHAHHCSARCAVDGAEVHVATCASQLLAILRMAGHG
jgi:hypothetical protein